VAGLGRAEHITERAVRAGVPVTTELAAALAAYVDFLSTWNRKINLTAVPLEPATDEAIDRLVIESLIAARHVLAEDRVAIDIGSGGGSPAIPLRMAAPWLRFVLVEVKSRKAAFLRAVARDLSLSNVEVENHNLAELRPRAELQGIADLVTMRAVRLDADVLGTIQRLLRPGGRVFWFGASGGDAELGKAEFLALALQEPLPQSGQLSVFQRHISS
jgi:16S rRNA (guanine527-N7)-methyltransferase